MNLLLLYISWCIIYDIILCNVYNLGPVYKCFNESFNPAGNMLLCCVILCVCTVNNVPFQVLHEDVSRRF